MISFYFSGKPSGIIKLVTRHLSVNRSSENNNLMAEIGKMDEPHRRRSERPCADPVTVLHLNHTLSSGKNERNHRPAKKHNLEPSFCSKLHAGNKERASIGDVYSRSSADTDWQPLVLLCIFLPAPAQRYKPEEADPDPFGSWTLGGNQRRVAWDLTDVRCCVWQRSMARH